MALRMRDFFCPVCWSKTEEIGRPDDPPPQCCGQPMRYKRGAPAIKFVAPHFNRSLGIEIRDAAHRDAELAKINGYIPTATDLARMIETPPEDMIKKARSEENRRKIQEKAERTWSALHAEGKV